MAKDPVSELKSLNVEMSMAKTCEVILKALDAIECEGAAKSLPALATIEQKIKEAEDYFWRPLDNPEVYERMVNIMEGVGENKKCKMYQCKLGEQEAGVWEFRGRMQNFWGNNVLAVEYYKKSLECDKNNELSIAGLEKASKRVAKANDAIAAAERAIEKKPDDAKRYVKLGMARLDKGDLSGAEEAFKEAIKVDPQSDDAMARLGHVYQSQHNLKDAEEMYLKAQEVKPTSMGAKRGLTYNMTIKENKKEFFP